MTNNPEQQPETFSILFAGDLSQALNKLAEEQGISKEEALRRAIATELYFYQEKQEGGKILVLKASKDLREVVFRFSLEGLLSS